MAAVAAQTDSGEDLGVPGLDDLVDDGEPLVGEAGWTLEDLRWVTINAMKSAFIPFDERLAIIDEVVKPGYAEILA